MAHNDQTYLFIDDPKHKLTLSGRVTAACLSCRRKKMKCSGEINCLQCREKGLKCDGPPLRKRPRQDHVLTTTPSTTLLRNEELHSQRSNNVRSPAQQQRPPARGSKGDSGYASHETKSRRPTSRDQMSPAGAHISGATPSGSLVLGQPYYSRDAAMSGNAAHPAANPGLTPFTTNNDHGYDAPVPQYSSATMTPAFEDWSGRTERSNTITSQHNYHPAINAVPENVYNTRIATAPAMSTDLGWDRKGSNEWWSDGSINSQSSTELLMAAHTLEQQAQDLRRQAASKQVAESEDLSLQPLSQMPPYPAMSEDPMQAAYYAAPLADPIAFDPSSFPRQGLMPLAGDGDSDSWSAHCERQATQAIYKSPLNSNPAPGFPAKTMETQMWNDQYALQPTKTMGRGRDGKTGSMPGVTGHR